MNRLLFLFFNLIYFSSAGQSVKLVFAETSNPISLDLKQRIENNNIQEIILALSATIEGQTTALVIKDSLEELKIKVTQLAYGVPVGSEIHYLDDNTLGAALESRKDLG